MNEKSENAHNPDWLRSFLGCEHYNNEEASEILDALDAVAHILLVAGERLVTSKTTPIIPINTNLKNAA